MVERPHTRAKLKMSSSLGWVGQVGGVWRVWRVWSVMGMSENRNDGRNKASTTL